MALERSTNRYIQGPSPSGLADVIDLILDKGLVIVQPRTVRASEFVPAAAPPRTSSLVSAAARSRAWQKG